MNYTLGPWHIHSVDGCGYYVLGPGDAPQFICTLDEGDYDCQAANAALIAAAPDLLDLVQKAFERFTDNDSQPPNHELKVWLEKVSEIFYEINPKGREEK